MHRLIIAAAALASVTTAQAAPPDLGGLWTSGSLTPLERPKDFKALTISEPEARAYEARRRNQPPPIEDDVGGADSEWWETDEPLQRVRGQPRTSLIVSPADGKLPFTAAAAARNKDRTARRKLTTDNPEDRGRGDRCLPGALAGPPMINGVYNNNFRIVQTRDHLVIQAEYLGDVRIVRLDPRARRGPPHVRRWLGESIGHWEGDTLVIVTTNFTATEVDAPDGDPAADAVVIERLTRLGPDRLGYAFTVRNPSLYVMPWQGEMELRTTAGPLFEVACHEGNYALRSMLAGSRQAEAQAPAQDGSKP
ncbi:MAG: hypothetical protein JNK30_16670 [Phenylobacterium sp.]|uniref:hypothetical protein n=1 Tax=Phenylobacterium sp. TaxID=1871053 RepID=UPI001A3AB71A|nr:hypothetical protein [Phenylobacterium sp.]MBL8773018.1 hypothetical protein [Phenylobacterium sp.]